MKIYVKGPNFSYIGDGEDDIVFLLETDKIDFNESFSYKGKTYNWCSFEPVTQRAIVEEFELKDLGKYDYYSEPEITCPYCGSALGDSWEMADEGDNEECEVCGGIYDYTRDVTVTYTSEKVKEPTIKEIN